MRLFKLIEIDMAKERDRVLRCGFTKRQQAALIKLYDLFEAGDWKACIQHVNDKRAFPRNKKGEYPETEHIGMAVAAVLRELGHENFWTSERLLAEAKEKLAKA